MAAPSLSDGAGFLDALTAAGARAADAVGGYRDLDLCLAGAPIRLRFAGPALIPALTAAFAHVRTRTAEPPALTVELWDSESTEAAMPAPPWGPGDYRAYGALHGYFGSGLYSVFQWGSHSLSVLDVEGSRGFYWIRSRSQLLSFEAAAPLRTLLYLWMRDRGLGFTHAGAVAATGGCALLAGPAGSGKSSTVLACLESELGILADDYCLLRPGPEAIVHSVYRAAKAHPDTLARLPSAAALVEPRLFAPGDKAVLLLPEDRMHLHAPLAAIIVMAIGEHEHSRVAPISPARALAALGPSTVLQLPGARAATLAGLAETVRSFPCYRLETGRDPRGVADAIVEVLAR